jgi:hypothetical protein
LVAQFQPQQHPQLYRAVHYQQQFGSVVNHVPFDLLAIGLQMAFEQDHFVAVGEGVFQDAGDLDVLEAVDLGDLQEQANDLGIQASPVVLDLAEEAGPAVGGKFDISILDWLLILFAGKSLTPLSWSILR